MNYTEARKNYAQAKAVKKIAEAVIELIDALTESDTAPHYEQLSLPFADGVNLYPDTPKEEPKTESKTETKTDDAPPKFAKAFPVDVEQIKRLMTARGYNTHTLASAMGIEYGAVYKALKRGTFSRRMMAALETALGVTAGSLWMKTA